MKAIVLGASGYLGKALVKALVTEQIPVIALTRKDQQISDLGLDCGLDNDAHNNLTFVKIDADNILDLVNNKEVIDFAKDGDSVFYNLVWKGDKRLRDGSLSDQFKNVTRASNAVITAAKLGASKFVHVSTQDEVLYADFLKHCKDRTFNENDMPYASAKLAAKQMCLIEAYINKIDFISTRFSAVIDKTLNAPSFITTNLKRIRDGEEFVTPANPAPLEINYLTDLANAYVAIGKYGKNKADYYIGQGELHTIKDYFLMAKAIKEGSTLSSTSSPIKNPLFDNSSFIADTNFKFTYTFKTMMEDILS